MINIIHKHSHHKGEIMKNYITPDFDIIIYEIEDIITLSINTNDSNGEGWWG